MQCYIAGNIPSLGHQYSTKNSKCTMWVVHIGQVVGVFLFCYYFPQRRSNKAGIANGSAEDLKSFFAISHYLVVYSIQVNGRPKLTFFYSELLNRSLQPIKLANSLLCKVVAGYQQGCHHPKTNYAALYLVILFHFFL